jgi:hypothetical protein
MNITEFSMVSDVYNSINYELVSGGLPLIPIVSGFCIHKKCSNETKV